MTRVLDRPDDPDLWPWEPLNPQALVAVMRGYDGVWGVAGGWAIELTLGTAPRAHHDVDVVVLRRDQGRLQRHFAGWELYYATTRRELIRWSPGELLEPPIHGIWARRSGEAPWMCEFLMDESDGEDWVYRRDPAVRLPLARLCSTYAGVPVLNPAVALLYKSKEPSSKDESDFAAAVALLGDADRAWLAQALPREHLWRARLGR